MVDDPDDDEIAEFEALDDETLARVERLNKWRASKNKSSLTPSSPPARQNRDLSLSELRDLMAEPSNRSILKSLLAEMEPLALTTAGTNVGGAGPGKATQNQKPRRFL